MSSLIFITDYLPLLTRCNKSAIALYLVYDKLKEDSGIVRTTYNELQEHLGLASSTISSVRGLLIKLELIEKLDGTGSVRVLPVKPLTEELRLQILTRAEAEPYQAKTGIRKRFLEDDIPAEYQQLLNKKFLQTLYKELGSLNAKALCKHLKLDYHTFKLLCERDEVGSFKTKFLELKNQISASKEPKKAFGPQERELATFLYDKLKALDAKPINRNWFSKNCNIAKSILETLSLSEAKQILEWGFADNWWHNKITDLSAINTLHSRFKLQHKKASKVSSSTPIPPDVKAQIEAIHLSFPINTYSDAAFLKQSILDGELNEDIRKAVTILEQSGIIPLGNSNLSFG
jgi:hypothetical protein